MNNIFTPEQDAVVTRIGELQEHATELIQQREKIKKDKALKEAYSITIHYVLEAIQRLTMRIEKEKPTDGNQ